MTLQAQEDLVVGLHYVTVKSTDEQKLIELEKTIFSKLHKKTITEGRKIGYDLWKVLDDHDVTHTTFIYAHLEPEFEFHWNWESQNIISSSELALAQEQWRSIVVKDEFIMTTYRGGFAPVNDKPVDFVQLGFMNVDPTRLYEYEQMEINQFMPVHKANKFIKGWGLHRIVTPKGENDPNYIVANFFESRSAIYENTNNVISLSKQEQKNYSEILKLRTMSKVQIAQLVLAVR